MGINVSHTNDWKDFRNSGFVRKDEIVRMEGRIITTFLPWNSIFFRETPRFIFDFENSCKIVKIEGCLCKEVRK